MKQNKLKKYIIKNITDDEIIGEKLTKKATLEWLSSMCENLTDEGHWEFAKVVFGPAIVDNDLNLVVIKCVNGIAVENRLTKFLKKELPFNGKLYTVRLDEAE